jgi:hypothetical protein
MLKIAIIGGGPAALSAAYFLSSAYKVTVYEKEKNIGQKFLVAGKGGFNLTNNLSGNELVQKYKPKIFLKNAIDNFDSTKTRAWFSKLGIETFTGTSGRVFAEKKHKPIDVLDAIRDALIIKNIEILSNHEFIGFDDKSNPIISTKNQSMIAEADYFIFALGGASWPITGSDGNWTKVFNKLGVGTIPLEPSNCGINITWPKNILKFHIGKPIKNSTIQIGEKLFTGEAVLTKYGLEGNLIYSAVPKIRKLIKNNFTTISLDFKPNNSENELLSKIKNNPPSTKLYKAKLNLNSTELALIKSFTKKEDFSNSAEFIKNIKHLKIPVNSLRPIDEAISTVGGIDIEELNLNFALRKYPKIFTIGEMVNWDAPTGGFLLQACFSMGKLVADHLNKLS